MTTFSFVLALAVAVLISAVINQLVRGVSTPLIQIGLGAAFAIAGFVTPNFEVEAELFLVLFIAPLLYDEARGVDKAGLWSNRTVVLSLAVALVIVSALAVGFVVNAIEPSVPLAAAFALGAALGPTDAVAVSSLSQRASLNRRQEVLLSSESLINDASGVVSFQFAVAALTTGAFSLIDATASFAVHFFGGIGLGLVAIAALSFIGARVRDMGLEDTTFHVLFDVLTPFLIYLAAEAVHVSGIIAVVAAGLAAPFLYRSIGPQAARLSIVSSSVWRVITFALNGIVFVLLGAQLPYAMTDMWEDRAVSNPELIAIVALIVLILFSIRALWFLGISYVARRKEARAEQDVGGGTPEQVRRVMRSVSLVTRESLREACALSLAGPKGAITLSIMFTLPYSVNFHGSPYSRDLLIFLACGVILLTLALANFVLPLLLPKRQEEASPAFDAEAQIDVLRAVIEGLAARQTRENRRATQLVIKQYNDRIDRIKQGLDDDEIPDGDDTALRLRVLDWERQFVLDAIDGGTASPVVGYRLLRRINQSRELVARDRDALWFFGVLRRRASLIGRAFLHDVIEKSPFPDELTELAEQGEVRELQAKSYEHVLGKLRAMLDDPSAPTEHVSSLMVEIQRDLRRVRRIRRDLGTAARIEDKATEVRRIGFSLELEQLQQLYEQGRITRRAFTHMRENVHMMQLELEDKV